MPPYEHRNGVRYIALGWVEDNPGTTVHALAVALGKTLHNRPHALEYAALVTADLIELAHLDRARDALTITRAGRAYRCTVIHWINTVRAPTTEGKPQP